MGALRDYSSLQNAPRIDKDLPQTHEGCVKQPYEQVAHGRQGNGEEQKAQQHGQGNSFRKEVHLGCGTRQEAHGHRNQEEGAGEGQGYHHGVEKKAGQPAQQELQKGGAGLGRHQRHGVDGLDALRHAVQEDLLEALGLQEEPHGDEVQELAHERILHLGQGIVGLGSREPHLEGEKLARRAEGSKEDSDVEAGDDAQDGLPHQQEHILEGGNIVDAIKPLVSAAKGCR